MQERGKQCFLKLYVCVQMFTSTDIRCVCADMCVQMFTLTLDVCADVHIDIRCRVCADVHIDIRCVCADVHIDIRCVCADVPTALNPPAEPKKKNNCKLWNQNR
uniref:Uncharacterized protein n=1 Tax=Takifugu rubripes TaxID=31033 RepID=A0A674N2F2_TAKRU